jgi:hypothetical protein
MLKTINARLRILKSQPRALDAGFWAQAWRAFAKRPEVQADIRDLEKLKRSALEQVEEQVEEQAEEVPEEVTDERTEAE